MCLEDAVNVALTGEDDAIIMLVDIQTIEFIENAKILEHRNWSRLPMRP